MAAQRYLTVEDRARLGKIEPWRWVLALILDWSMVVAGFVLFSLSGKPLWMAPIVALLIGSAFNALGALAHECAHKLAFNSRKLNDWVGNVLITWPMFISIGDNYRPWHFEHHRHLGTDKDAELSYRSGWAFQPPIRLRRVLLLVVLDLFGFGIPNIIAFFKGVLPKQRRHLLGPLLTWSAFLAITLYLDASWVFFLYLYAVVAGFWTLSRVRTWAEHVALREEYAPAYRVQPGLLARWFVFHHNGWCHYEHHLYPQIPFYNLPATRALDPNAKVLTAFDLFWNLEKYTSQLRPLPSARSPLPSVKP